MATIRSKHSSVANKAPISGDLVEGEIALNINPASPAAYIKDSAGAVVKIAGAGSVSAPDATTTTKGVVQYADAAAVTAGTASRAVDAAQLKAALVQTGATAPTSPKAGQLWVDGSVSPSALKIWNAVSGSWEGVMTGGGGGTAGPQGPTGPTGATGPAGVGIQGPKGDRGDKGDQGDRGSDGVTGPRGSDGPMGPQGPAGSVASITGTQIAPAIVIANSHWISKDGNNYMINEIGQGYSIHRDTQGGNLPLMMCFGTQVCNGDGTRINFPVGFNVAPFIQLTPHSAPAATGSFSVHVFNPDAGGFSVAVRYNTAPATHLADVEVHWFAIAKRPSW
jgi:hypothetical protein